MVLISHENSDYSSFSSLRRYIVTWFGSLGSGVAGDKQLLASCFPSSSLFSIFYISLIFMDN